MCREIKEGLQLGQVTISIAMVIIIDAHGICVSIITVSNISLYYCCYFSEWSVPARIRSNACANDTG